MKKIKVPEGIRTALITGADGDIGFQFARTLAYAGVALVLVSNREDGLQKAQEKLRAEFNTHVEYFYCDLASKNAAQSVYDFCTSKNIEVDLLINNAGIFFYEEFISTDPKKISLMINLHVVATTELCRLFGADMAQRKKGFILNVSSMTAWMPMPGLQMYASTKCFLYTFSRAISYELKLHNVGVTVICPGGVNTSLYNLPEKLRKIALRIGWLISPEKLAYKALRKTFRFKKKSLVGFTNYVFVFFIRTLPERLIFAIMKRLPVFNKNR